MGEKISSDDKKRSLKVWPLISSPRRWGPRAYPVTHVDIFEIYSSHSSPVGPARATTPAHPTPAHPTPPLPAPPDSSLPLAPPSRPKPRPSPHSPAPSLALLKVRCRAASGSAPGRPSSGGCAPPSSAPARAFLARPGLSPRGGWAARPVGAGPGGDGRANGARRRWRRWRRRRRRWR